MEKCGLGNHIYTSKEVKWTDKEGNEHILAGIRPEDEKEIAITDIIPDKNGDKHIIYGLEAKDNETKEIEELKLSNIELQNEIESLKNEVLAKENEITKLNNSIAKEIQNTEYWKNSKLDSIDYKLILGLVMSLVAGLSLIIIVYMIVRHKLEKDKAIYSSEIRVREKLALSPLETFEEHNIKQIENKYT